MRSLSILFFVLLSGCAARRLSAVDAQLLRGAPLVRVTPQPVGKKAGNIHLDPDKLDPKSPDSPEMEGFRISIIGGALLSKDFVPSPGPFVASAPPWSGLRAPPSDDALFDPTPILGFELLARMQSAGLAARDGDGSSVAALVLEVRIDTLMWTAGGGRFALTPFDASARLRTAEGRLLWEGRCEISPVVRERVGEKVIGIANQALLDRSALACAEKLAGDLQAMLPEAATAQ